MIDGQKMQRIYSSAFLLLIVHFLKKYIDKNFKWWYHIPCDKCSKNEREEGEYGIPVSDFTGDQ